MFVRLSSILGVGCGALMLTMPLYGQDLPFVPLNQQPAPAANGAPPAANAAVPAAQDGVDVMTRGPVHEAFAEPVIRAPRATPALTGFGWHSAAHNAHNLA